MSRKHLLAAGTIGLALILGACSSDSTKTDKDEDTKNSSESNATDNKSDDEKESASQAETSSEYITLADFDADKSKYDDYRKVYFFHASWCPTCKGIDDGLNSDLAALPKDTVIIKTDYDTENELKKEYGVTTQTTFVEVDNSGKELKKFTAGDYEDLVSELEA